MKYPRLPSEEVKRGRVSFEAQEARMKAWHAKHGPNVFPDDDGNPVEAAPKTVSRAPVTNIVAMATTSKPVASSPVVAPTNTSVPAVQTVKVAQCGTPLVKDMRVKRQVGKDDMFFKVGRVVKVDDNFTFVQWKDGMCYWYPNKGLFVDD